MSADAGCVDCLYEHSSASVLELNERTLLVRVGGDVRAEDIAPFFEALDGFLAERPGVRVLIDATYFGEAELGLRWHILRRLRTVWNRIDRTAIYGLSPKLEALLWLAFTLGRRTDVRTFLWRHEAEGWVVDEHATQAA